MSLSANHSYTFDYVHLAPSEQIDLHQDSSWELSYIITGAGMRLIGDTYEPFQEGEVVLVPPGVPHCWYFDENVTDAEGKIENIALWLGEEFLQSCSTSFPELEAYVDRFKEEKSAVRFTTNKAEELGGILLEMCTQSPAECISSIIRILIVIHNSSNELVIGQFLPMNKEQKRLAQIRTYVVCNSRRDITLDDVARHVGMNRASFCVFFKKATGKTFVNYLNEYRIELACQLLQERSMAISEICYSVGFNNVPYFNRVFKRKKGYAPSALIVKG